MFVLSILPLNSLAIVLIGLFTSEASIVEPSDTCAGDIFPKVSLCGLACSSVRLYYNTLSGILSLMSREKSMNIAITIIVAVLVMFGFWIYDLKQDVAVLRTDITNVEDSHYELRQTLIDYYPQDYEFLTSRLNQNEEDIELVRQTLEDTLKYLQAAGF